MSNHPIESLTALGNDGIARREVTTVALGGSVQGALDEFSMVSLLGQLESVKQPVTPYEKQLASELIKTAAVLQQVVMPKSGRYAVPNGEQLSRFDGCTSGERTTADAGLRNGSAGMNNSVDTQTTGHVANPLNIISPSANSPVDWLE